jgi:hypothetical protein
MVVDVSDGSDGSPLDADGRSGFADVTGRGDAAVVMRSGSSIRAGSSAT